nr:phospholipase D-like domain-containing protein [uncultured Niameybacter sp.]
MEEYKEYQLLEAKFISGKGEMCYKEVLDDFERAEFINILTYNISAKSSDLIEKIIESGQRNIPIRIITNIPSRWAIYYNEKCKEKAKKGIQLYTNKLNPERLGKLASVFFRVDNHAKIIMTDNIIYWGSANYSDESKNNYECGTISRDREFIKFVEREVIPTILDESLSYYEYDFLKYVASIYSAMTYMHNMYEDLYEASYEIHSDYDTNFKEVVYFNCQENDISWKQLENIMEVTIKFEGVLQEIINELEEQEDVDLYQEILELLSRYLEHFSNMKHKISNLCYDLEEMARYPQEDAVMEILNREYGHVAYEEKLDFYIELAIDEVASIRESIIESSKKSIELLLKIMQEYEGELRKLSDDIIVEFRKRQPLNKNIDNTK